MEEQDRLTLAGLPPRDGTVVDVGRGRRHDAERRALAATFVNTVDLGVGGRQTRSVRRTREELVALVADLGPVMEERAVVYDREASFPWENFHDFRDRGLLGLCIPESHGGLGASFADYVRVSEEIGRHCGATGLTFNMHTATMLWTGEVADLLDMTDDERARHDEVRAELFRGVVEEGHLHSQPFSEGVSPGATSGVTTRAVPVEGGFLVTGRKIFASLSGAADFYNVTARVDGEPARGEPQGRRARTAPARGEPQGRRARTTPARGEPQGRRARTTPARGEPQGRRARTTPARGEPQGRRARTTPARGEPQGRRARQHRHPVPRRPGDGRRRAHRGHVGPARHARDRVAHPRDGRRLRARRERMVAARPLRPGPERYPWLFMSLAPTYLGITRGLCDFTRRYLRGEQPA